MVTAPPGVESAATTVSDPIGSRGAGLRCSPAPLHIQEQAPGDRAAECEVAGCTGRPSSAPIRRANAQPLLVIPR